MTQYGPEGFIADLPDLIRGREEHACAGYYDDLDHFVLLVVGGHGDGDYLSSTEIFQVGVSSQWTEVSALPYRILVAPRATTVNNVIYITGKEGGQETVICLMIF